jgi:polyferredoxin
MKEPVNRIKPVLSTRLAFLMMFTVFYWGVYFLLRGTSLQLNQAVFNLAAGVFAGAVTHVAMAKIIGPLLFGRAFCGWACWNAGVFDILPVGKVKRCLPENYYVIKYPVLVAAMFLPVIFIWFGGSYQSRTFQLKSLLIQNAVIYVIGIALAWVLGDRRAFCKYLCPSAALMTFTAPLSILKIEKNHLNCSKCRRCEEVCPMDIPIVNYISNNLRVAHPECILCAECIRYCPRQCLTIGTGRKSDTTPEYGRSY